MLYTVTKINVKTEEETVYTHCSELDVKDIVKGYKFNGLFYERANSNYMYIVDKQQ